MDRFQRFERFVSAALIVFVTAGCASIIHGSTQSVSVTSIPSGAVVRVNLNNMATATPGVVTLDRRQTGYVLTFEKQGYMPVEVSLRRTVDGWIFGNIIFGLSSIIGLVIDFSTGSAYKLTPTEVSVTLAQMGASLKEADGDLLVFVDMEKLPEQVKARIANEKKAA